jgi:ABC-type multidrug transport system ATPase subunit
MITEGFVEPAATTGGVTARGLRRTFGPVVAVDSIDLDVPPGQVTALVGPNGSGKTTLMLMLAGLLVPDAGHVRVAGHDPVTDPVAVRRHVGWMPDVFGTWDTLTAREVLLTFADAYWVPRAEAAERAADLLARLHLTELADAPAHVLSRGQKQRLGLARALVHSPAVLLLDEPASGLDPRSRVELRSLLRALAATGTAVLVSSHVLAELDELADRAVFVARGRTVAQRRTDEETGGPRRWRVRSLDGEALAAALGRAGVPVGQATTASPTDLVVALASERAAAELLAALVRDGVPVTAFAPLHGSLEDTYLGLDEGERR